VIDAKRDRIEEGSKTVLIDLNLEILDRFLIDVDIDLLACISVSASKLIVLTNLDLMFACSTYFITVLAVMFPCRTIIFTVFYPFSASGSILREGCFYALCTIIPVGSCILAFFLDRKG